MPAIEDYPNKPEVQ